jgi:hypothetical protein
VDVTRDESTTQADQDADVDSDTDGDVDRDTTGGDGHWDADEDVKLPHGAAKAGVCSRNQRVTYVITQAPAHR